MIRKLLIAALALGALAALPSSAVAQENVVLTDKQVEYFVKAGKALESGEQDQAVEYYKLALKAGEANVLYAALGRALYRKGRCAEADEAYQKALTAPTVAEPPPASVREKIEEYRIGLRVECPGTLQIKCEPADMKVRVSGGARRACSEFPIELKADFYRIEGSAGGEIVESEVKIVGMETATVELKIDVKAEPVGPVGGTTPPPDDSSLGLVGLVTAGIGGALLATAVVYDLAVLGPAVDDLETAAGARSADEQAKFDDASSAQTTTLILYIGGGVLATAGVLMWVLMAPDEAPEQTGGLQPWLGPDGAGVTYGTRW
jgi:hypothetical protein